LKNYNFIKISVIGIIPILTAIDCIASAAFYSLIFFISTSVISLFLFMLKNTTYRTKYVCAAILSVTACRAVSDCFLSAGACRGFKPEIFFYAAAISIPALYIEYEFKRFNGFGDFLKHYSLVTALSITLILTYGLLTTFFSVNLSGATTIFSYPATTIILMSIAALLLKKMLEKLI